MEKTNGTGSENKMSQRWKDIKGYEGSYQVSNQGKVKSIIRKNRAQDKLLKLQKTPNGYRIVTLYKNGIPNQLSVHRLVLDTFIGESDLQCNHKNGIKNDNRLENLEWCSCSENHKHAFVMGLKNLSGENHNNSKLTREQVLLARSIHKYVKPLRGFWKRYCRLLDVSPKTLLKAIRGISWGSVS